MHQYRPFTLIVPIGSWLVLLQSLLIIACQLSWLTENMTRQPLFQEVFNFGQNKEAGRAESPYQRSTSIYINCLQPGHSYVIAKVSSGTNILILTIGYTKSHIVEKKMIHTNHKLVKMRLRVRTQELGQWSVYGVDQNLVRWLKAAPSAF